MNELNLKNDRFAVMLAELDNAIRRAPVIMQDKHLDTATLTLKVSIKVKEAAVKDEDTVNGYRAALKPDISYKLKMKLEANREVKETITNTTDEMTILDDGTVLLADGAEQMSFIGR